MCHVSCNELKKLVSGAEIQGFSLRAACAVFMSMELFHGIFLSRGVLLVIVYCQMDGCLVGVFIHWENHLDLSTTLIPQPDVHPPKSKW